MSNADRLYKIERLIPSNGSISFAALLAELEVSPATLKRDLEYLRSRMGAPIEYDRSSNGYRFAAGKGAGAGQRHELPGLWFDEAELYSLLMAQQLLAGLDSGGLLSRHLQPLLDRIHQLLGAGGKSGATGDATGGATDDGTGGGTGGDGPDAAEQLMRRVKVISALRRPVPSRFFERVSTALMSRRRLHLRYLTRTRRDVSERDVSPQRLVHYRNTWYLDAWCHRTDALRRFALDAIEQATVLDVKARNVPVKRVEAEMDAGYGIYAGGTRRTAVLRFDAQAAQWASKEEWHPEQEARWLDDGRFELQLPYVDDTELVMDVLRQGEQVQVVEPAELVRAVRQRLVAALGRYSETMDAETPGNDQPTRRAT